MTNRIFRSIFLVAISVLIAVVFLIMGVSYNYFSSAQLRQLDFQAQLASEGVEKGGIDYLNGLSSDEYRITWIDTDGYVIYDNQFISSEMENHLEREEIKAALEKGKGHSSRYSTTLMERQMYSAVRITDGTVIRISGSHYTVLTLIMYMIYPLVVIVVLAIAVSLILSFRISKKIVRPLNEINLDNPKENKDVYEELLPLIDRIKSQQRQLKLQSVELKKKRDEFFISVNEKEKAEQMRREFTANVSHELKTPIQTIFGCAELLTNGIVKSEDVPKFSGQIYTESKRMINLIEDIIKLSHLDEGAEDMQIEKTDLYQIAQNTIIALYPAAEQAGVELELTGCHAEVFGISHLIDGIIFNICDNAIKYNRENGSVNVVISEQDNNVVLSVSDTGIGIPEDQQERIFERFYRVDKSHSKAVGGTGLGLSIVKHAAKLHNAEIKVKSSPGYGTTISVYFPKEKM